MSSLRRGSRDRIPSEKGRLYRMEQDQTELQRLEKVWQKSIEESRKLLDEAGGDTQLTQCRADLLVAENKYKEYRELHKDATGNIEPGTLLTNHSEVLIQLDHKLFQALIVAKSSGGSKSSHSQHSSKQSHKSNSSHKSTTTTIEEEAKLAKIDLSYLEVQSSIKEEQAKLEHKLRHLEFTRTIERGKALSQSRSVDPMLVSTDSSEKSALVGAKVEDQAVSSEVKAKDQSREPSKIAHNSQVASTHQQSLSISNITRNVDSHTATQHMPAQGDKSNSEGYSHVPCSTSSQATDSCHPSVSAANQQILLSRLPMPKPRKFDGNALQFPSWKTAFETLIVQSGMPEKERLYYLSDCLEPNSDAWKGIQGYFILSSSTAYYEAMQQLESRYGNKHVIAAAFRRELTEWPRVPDKDHLALRRFSDFTKQCLTAKQSYDSLNILDDEAEHLKVLTKLPDSLVTRWTRKINDARNKCSKFPLFDRFVEFIVAESDLACEPVLSLAAVKSLGSKSSDSMFNKSSRQVSFSNSNRHSSTVHAIQTEKQVSEGQSQGQSRSTGSHCLHCQSSSHYLDTCDKMMKLSLEDRKAFVMANWLCWGCLRKGHVTKFCRRRLLCNICKSKHPTVFHSDTIHHKVDNTDRVQTGSSVYSRGNRQDNQGAGKGVRDATCHYVDQAETDKCSMIIPVYVSHRDSPQHEKLVYCLLDSQSDTTFIRSDIVRSINVSGIPVTLSLSTIASQCQLVDSEVVEGLVVRGYDNVSCKNSVYLPKTYTRDIMPANRSHIPTKEKISGLRSLEFLNDILSDELDIPVALLIGYSCARALRPVSVISSDNESLYAQQSVLGWGVVGFVCTNSTQEDDKLGFSHTCDSYEVKGSRSSDSGHFSSICFRSSVKEVMSPTDCCRLLEQDFKSTDSESPYSVEDTRFLSIVSKQIRQQEDGHYVLPLPFKGIDRPEFPCNRRVALHRLSKLRDRFIRDPKYYSDYSKVMDKLLSQGHASIVDNPQYSDVGRAWFLPHHGVYQPRKPDKLRVVFDGSSKYKGVSLNECLLTGPDLINSLCGILCRFRQDLVAFSCDIQEMFHQFVVDSPYRDYLRFYWYKDNNYSLEPSVYTMNRHLFGSTSSPGCSNFCLKQLASDYQNSDNKQACDFVKRSFYVDDGLISVSSSDEAIKLIKDTVTLCAKGSLKLHKFISNCPIVRQAVDAEQEQTRSSFIERTLGVVWCLESDSLQFRIVIDSKPFTRRGVLSIVSSIFDPLGLVGPYVLEGKRLLQEICASGVKWDDPVPNSMSARWRRWLGLIVNLNSLVIPRCYKSESLAKIDSVEIHHFSDASSEAYGQCSYVRFKDVNDKVWCSLLMGKSRVAPVKIVSIPRLELSAAVLSVKVSLFLTRELDYENVCEYFWSDSTATLSYIRCEARRFHTFVANRVQFIRDNTRVSSWKYVRTDKNPADDASRGLDLGHVDSSHRWFTGPSFLWSSSWKEFQCSDVSLKADDKEVKSVVFSSIACVHLNILECLSVVSSWTKLRKIVAIWRRFICIRRGKPVLRSPTYTVEELASAETTIVRLVQAKYLGDEIKCLSAERSVLCSSQLSKLCPMLDSKGVIRVGGRLKQSGLPYEVKHPCVLPRCQDCYFSRILIVYFHNKVHHQGRAATVSVIRDSGYWVLSCIAGVSGILHSCVLCRKLYTCPSPQKMADLPSDRFHSEAPFTYCAVDLFGPYSVREGRKSLKRYGVIFVCLCSKGIHIEVANSLSTDSFLNAFRRLVSIRGAVRSLRSDCGSNFIGANREIRAELDALNHQQIKEQLSNQSCDYTVYKFNKPYASHTGGIWERQIRSVRRVMSSLLSSLGTQLDDESLRTFLCEAAGIVNSRPLSVDTLADVNSPKPISPNSILTMKSSVILPPPGNFEEEQTYTKRRWRTVQYLSEQFWRRWRKEYIQNLQVRSKWCKPMRNYAIGDIVFLTDVSVPRCDWKVCKVIEAYAGTDGLVRSVKLLVGNKSLDQKGKPRSAASVLQRSVHKLILLVGTT